MYIITLTTSLTKLFCGFYRHYDFDDIIAPQWLPPTLSGQVSLYPTLREAEEVFYSPHLLGTLHDNEFLSIQQVTLIPVPALPSSQSILNGINKLNQQE